MNRETISEINHHISDALEQWSDIMNKADADQWAYQLEYTDDDLLHALQIFSHVAQNIAIKSNYYRNVDDIKHKMDAFKNGVKIGFDFDTIELTNKCLKEN